jgi:lactoylglutathione lyase
MSDGAVSLNLVVIQSADLERSARFYAALGIRLAPERHGTGPEHLAGRVGGVVLELYPSDGVGSAAIVRLGFCVPSLAAVLTELSEAGGLLVSPPKESPWGLRAVVADPDSHRIELVEDSGAGLD